MTDSDVDARIAKMLRAVLEAMLKESDEISSDAYGPLVMGIRVLDDRLSVVSQDAAGGQAECAELPPDEKDRSLCFCDGPQCEASKNWMERSSAGDKTTDKGGVRISEPAGVRIDAQRKVAPEAGGTVDPDSQRSSQSERTPPASFGRLRGAHWRWSKNCQHEPCPFCADLDKELTILLESPSCPKPTESDATSMAHRAPRSVDGAGIPNVATSPKTESTTAPSAATFESTAGIGTSSSAPSPPDPKAEHPALVRWRRANANGDSIDRAWAGNALAVALTVACDAERKALADCLRYCQERIAEKARAEGALRQLDEQTARADRLSQFMCKIICAAGNSALLMTSGDGLPENVEFVCKRLYDYIDALNRADIADRDYNSMQQERDGLKARVAEVERLLRNLRWSGGIKPYRLDDVDSFLSDQPKPTDRNEVTP